MRFEMGVYIFVLLVMFFWGVSPILGKLGLSNISPIAGLTIRTFSVAIILLIYGLLSGEIAGILGAERKNIILLAGEGILASLLGHFAYYYALKYGEASKVVPLISAYPLITMAFGVLFLNETLSWQKIGGAVLIIFGLLLLT